MKKWLSQWTQFMQLRKEVWKNSGIQRGMNQGLAIPMRCSTNWAMNSLTLKAGQLWIHMFPWKKWFIYLFVYLFHKSLTKNTIVTLSLSNISLAFFKVSSPRAIASCAVLLALVTFVNRSSSLLIRSGHSAIFLLTSSSFLLKLCTKVSSVSRICWAFSDAMATASFDVLSFAESKL